MAQLRKPIPKTPAQRVQEKIEPYDQVDYGKEPPVSEPRAKKISVRGSRVKDFSVKLIDIDEAVLKHIKENIKPSVYQNNELIEVPTIYAYPERWVAIQKEGYLRDVNNKILTPIIVVNRTDITKNRTIGRNLDGNYSQLVHVFEQTYTQKNAYDNFNVLNNRIPVKEMKVVAHPDYVTVTYELVIYTNFVEQLNRVIESIQYAENSYWGDKNRYYFRVNATTFSTVNAYTVNEERTVSSKVTLTLHGYLIPDTINAFLSHDLNYVSKGQVVFNGESTLVPKTSLAVPFRIPISTNSNGDNVSQATLQAMSLYLSTNTFRNATLTGLFEARVYGANILLSPTTLPPTSKTSFTVLLNGVVVNQTDIISIEQVGTDIVITFDTTVVPGGFDLNPPVLDTVTLIGKFT